MILIKTPKEINGIRASSRLAAATLKYTSSFIKPGVSTEFLNQKAHEYIISHQAIPAPLNYGGFPKSICTSINNVVCHGIPSVKEILKEGDIINIDITTIKDGYYGDTSATYPVGKISKDAQKLIDVTKKSLDLAIKSVKANKYLNECVGKVIEDYVLKFGYSPVRDLGGHGVGIKFHEDPFVFHYDTARNHILLKSGMIFTIEPMINASKNWQVYMDADDGWTIRTRDNSLSAQFEHTILVTSDGRKAVISNYKQWGAAPPPPDVWIDDPTLPAGKVVQDEQRIPGLKTAFDWTVTRNGEVINQKTFTSSFVPWAAVFRRGTGN